jgi:pimeloyl-ACP methyl ester carboxylesterase
MAITARPIQAGELRGSALGTASAPPLVLLHGNGESHQDLMPVAELLAEEYRVFALDSRAHGDSPRGAGPLTITRMADDVIVALDDLGIDQAHLVGFSDGGNIALEFATKHPERVASLITYGANLFPSGATAKTFWETWAQYLAYRLRGLASAEYRAKADRHGLMAYQPHISRKSLGVVTAPALIAAGEYDLIREAHTRLIADALPNGEVLIVPGATHGLPIKDPARFAGIVRDFLSNA